MAAWLVPLVCASWSSASWSAVWQNVERLDPTGAIELRWNSSWPADGVLVLEVAARTRGYVGLGLSPSSGTMAGADLVLAWVDDAGVSHARDYWADKNGSPTLDAKQDWAVLAACENDTHTIMRLARKVHTNNDGDVQIQPGPMHLIYSWSGADPGRSPHYHGRQQRGACVVNLLSASSRSGAWAGHGEHSAGPVLAAAVALSLAQALRRGDSQW